MAIEKISFLLIILLIGHGAFCQKWAIRPELLLTTTRAQFVSNTTNYLPFGSVHSNRPDIALMADYYLKSGDRLSFGIGTFSVGYEWAHIKDNGNGWLGFLFPSGSFSSGLGGGAQALASYQFELFKRKQWRSKLFLIGGVNAWYTIPSNSSSDGFYWGNSNVLYDTAFRVNTFTAGAHAGAAFLWKNKSRREIMQFTVRLNTSFGAAQHKIVSNYDLQSPQILPDQTITHKLTGASIQIGISKTLLYLPRQKKWAGKKD